MDKYKIMSGFMALVAVFLVFTSLNYLKISLPNPDLKSQQGNLSFELDKDWDNDGLDNREESYWNTDPNNSDTDGDGYLDGEEVASGHDPLIPAPGDLLPSEDNLTMKMSQLALSGIYEGALKPDNSNYETSLNNLVAAITNNAATSFNVDLSSIKLRTVNSNMHSQQTYIEELSPVYEEFLKVFVNQMYDLEENLNNVGLHGLAYSDVSKSFSNSSDSYKKVIDSLSKINVPKNWESNHLGVIKLVGELSQASQSVVSGQNDPVKAMISLNKIIQLWEVLPDVTEAYSEKIKSAKLNLSTTIFK